MVYRVQRDAGATAFPNDLREASDNFRIHGWDWWRRVILPASCLLFTGAITASGGSWNASIVAEYVEVEDQTVAAHGVGAYIAQATEKGDIQKSSRRRGDVDLRRHFQSAVLAPVYAMRTPPAAVTTARLQSGETHARRRFHGSARCRHICQSFLKGSGEAGPRSCRTFR